MTFGLFQMSTFLTCLELKITEHSQQLQLTGDARDGQKSLPVGSPFLGRPATEPIYVMPPSDSDVAVVESDRFSFDCTVADGVTYDCPLGDDLAHYLSTRLKADFPGTTVEGPILDDCWCRLFVYLGDKQYDLSINWVATKSQENLWALQFSESRGCLMALFGRCEPAHRRCRHLIEMVDQVLESDRDTFREIRWLTDNRFEEFMRTGA